MGIGALRRHYKDPETDVEDVESEGVPEAAETETTGEAVNEATGEVTPAGEPLPEVEGDADAEPLPDPEPAKPATRRK